MKLVLKVIILLLFVMQLSQAETFGVISNIIGKARVYSVKRKTWRAARIRQKLYTNDKVNTAEESIVEIQCTNKGVVRISDNSIIKLSSDIVSKRQSVKIFKGKIWANMKKIVSTHNKFSIQTPTATAAIRGTVFRANTAKDSSTDVLVYHGKVDVGPSNSLKNKIESQKKADSPVEVGGPMEVAGPTEVSLETWVSIVAGQQISIQHNGQYRKFKFDQKQDAQKQWVKFNQEQDELLKGASEN